MNDICNKMATMTMDRDDEDLDCENDKPSYYGGVYILWKHAQPIYGDIFIYDSKDAFDDYSYSEDLHIGISMDEVKETNITLLTTFYSPI